MTRFFFDYATQGQYLYDYRGDEFRNLDAAVEHASVIADNLKFTLDNQWTGWWIEVRNAEGAKLSSVPVPTHSAYDAAAFGIDVDVIMPLH